MKEWVEFDPLKSYEPFRFSRTFLKKKRRKSGEKFHALLSWLSTSAQSRFFQQFFQCSEFVATFGFEMIFSEI